MAEEAAVSGLDQVIRARLAAITERNHPEMQSMRDALLAVLDLHQTGDDDHLCVDEIIGYSVQRWYRDEPCPTLRVIAEKLGVETTDAST